MSDSTEFLIKLLHSRVNELVECLHLIEQQYTLKKTTIDSIETVTEPKEDLHIEIPTSPVLQAKPTVNFSSLSIDEIRERIGEITKPLNAMSLFGRLYGKDCRAPFSQFTRREKTFYKTTARKINQLEGFDKERVEETDQEDADFKELSTDLPPIVEEPSSDATPVIEEAPTLVVPVSNSISAESRSPAKPRKSKKKAADIENDPLVQEPAVVNNEVSTSQPKKKKHKKTEVSREIQTQ